MFPISSPYFFDEEGKVYYKSYYIMYFKCCVWKARFKSEFTCDALCSISYMKGFYSELKLLAFSEDQLCNSLETSLVPLPAFYGQTIAAFSIARGHSVCRPLEGKLGVVRPSPLERMHFKHRFSRLQESCFTLRCY